MVLHLEAVSFEDKLCLQSVEIERDRLEVVEHRGEAASSDELRRDRLRQDPVELSGLCRSAVRAAAVRRQAVVDVEPDL